MTHADLPLAIEAARSAGAILRRAFGTQMPVEYKSADQPVTKADLDADRFLRQALLDSRPSYGWLSEESLPAEWLGGDRIWIVDSLDGTANFVAGSSEFAVSIGLLDRGTPTLGVVYYPMADETYHAVRGGGAFRGELPIRVASESRQPPLLVASPRELARGRLDCLRTNWRISTLGSTALKIVHVAEGGADAFVSFSKKGLWDIVGGATIAIEAGATLTNLGGEELVFSTDSVTFEGLIVLSGSSADRLPSIVQAIENRHSGSAELHQSVRQPNTDGEHES